MRQYTKELYDFLSDTQKIILENHLYDRFSNQYHDVRFNVVFDLLHQCNINCIGCGTNAVCLKETQCIENPNLTYDSVEKILLKIKEYSEYIGTEVFINFGGGEPFLRRDIIKILCKASELFGVQGVGIDTNASLPNSYDLIKEAAPFVSYIGISINGLHDYHNWWANNHSFDVYSRAIEVVRKLCEKFETASKLEVTTVATTKNIDTIPNLMIELASSGVKNYSVHRAIPVGRMEKLRIALIPSWKQYLFLLIAMVETASKIGMNAHLHHSIEGIHGALMCGINTMAEEKMIDKNHRSSIGVEPDGEIMIDPWCMVGHWRVLSLGNALRDDKSLKKLFTENQEKIQAIQSCYASRYRCNGCQEYCSGGSRIVSAATYLKGFDIDTDIADIYHAFSEIDPACPFYEVEKNERIK